MENQDSNSILASLSSPNQKPDYSPILKQFKRSKIASLLNVQTGYISNILSGYKKPSKALEARLKALSDSVKAEMLEVSND